MNRIAVLEAASASHHSATRLRPWIVVVAGIVIFAAGIGAGICGNRVMLASIAPREPKLVASNVANKSAGQKAFEEGDYAKAMKLLLPLASQGDARSQLMVGEIFYHDRDRLGDDKEAIKWFRLAAEQDNADAQFHLGEMYAQGHSVPQDFAEATRWLRFAAEQGYARAQYNLGLAYAKGEGVAQDNLAAHMWFNLAASRFHASDSSNRSMAVKNRDLIASKMTSDVLAKAHRLASEWRPK